MCFTAPTREQIVECHESNMLCLVHISWSVDLPHNVGRQDLEKPSPKICAGSCEKRSSDQFRYMSKSERPTLSLTSWKTMPVPPLASYVSPAMRKEVIFPKILSLLHYNQIKSPRTLFFFPKVSLSGGNLIPNGLREFDINNCALL